MPLLLCSCCWPQPKLITTQHRVTTNVTPPAFVRRTTTVAGPAPGFRGLIFKSIYLRSTRSFSPAFSIYLSPLTFTLCLACSWPLLLCRKSYLSPGWWFAVCASPRSTHETQLQSDDIYFQNNAHFRARIRTTRCDYVTILKL